MNDEQFPSQRGEYPKEIDEIYSMIEKRDRKIDTEQMYNVMTDLFPGIEACINANLTIKEYCNKTGFKHN